MASRGADRGGRRAPVPLDATCAAAGCDAPRDRLLAIQLLALLPALAAALRACGFRRVYTALGRMSARRARRGAGRGAGAAECVAAVVVHVNRHALPYQSKCLLESLSLWFLLRRRGFPADLVLGARTLLGPLEAHAWVELDGRVLNDTADVRDVYEPFSLGSIAPGPGSR